MVFLRAHLPYLLAIAALWLAMHPYYGVIHDARLYAVQAFNEIYPGRFDRDLYFSYGSQDSFSIFSALYAKLVENAGLTAGNVIALALGHGLWLAGLMFLIGAFVTRPDRIFLGVAAAVVLPGDYGGLNIFSYGEPFVTPRLFAEAFVLIALGLLARRRIALSLALLAISAAVHPLMTLPAVAISLVFLSFSNRNWLWVIAACPLILLALASAGVEPFGRLFVTFDEEWFRVVGRRDAFAFMLQWKLVDYCHVIAIYCMSAIAFMLGTEGERRFFASVILVATGGLLTTFVGGDLLHNVFLVNIQPWRAQWILTLAANVGAATALDRIPTGFSRPRYLAYVALLATARYSPFSYVASVAAFLLLTTQVYRVGRDRHGASHAPLAGRAMATVAVIVSCTLLIMVAYATYETPRFMEMLVRLMLTVAGLLALSYAVMRSSQAAADLRVTAAAAACLLLALLSWDRRDEWRAFVESDAQVPTELAAVIAARNVYWQGGAEMLWLKLKKPSYFSCLQGSGAMFFRRTALEFGRRSTVLSPLGAIDLNDDLCPPAQRVVTDRNEPAQGAIAAVCRHERDLDYVVSSRQVDDAAYAKWVPPAAQEYVVFEDGRYRVHRIDAYYLYRCADFR